MDELEGLKAEAQRFRNESGRLKQELRDLVAQMFQAIDEKGVREEREFCRECSRKYGVPLPASWTPTVQRDAGEVAARKAGWRGDGQNQT